MHTVRLLLAAILCLGQYGIAAGSESAPPPLRLISYNVFKGFQESEPRRQAVTRWLAEQKPDVVAFMELNGYSEARLQQEAKDWGHGHAVLLKRDGFPTGLTSRAPITDVQRVLDGFNHGVIRARSLGMTFYVIHLSPLDCRVRLLEAGRILDGFTPKAGGPLPGALASTTDGPVVLIGDFNALSPLDRAWYESSEVLDFTRKNDRKPGRRNLDDDGGLDYRVIARFTAAGFSDVVREKHATAGDSMSFPTPMDDPKLTPAERGRIQQRIDYLLASPDLAKTCIRADIVNDTSMDGLSDHYPLVADFTWPDARP